MATGKQNTIKQKPRASSGKTMQKGAPGKIQQQALTAPQPFHTRILLVAVILVLTFAAYYPSLKNGMMRSWDDQAYITQNALVKSLSANNIIKIFKEDKGLYANYHPLTTLSLAVNYHFSKEEPFGYHLTNLLLHLLNTLLVFIFIYKLTKNNLVIAAVTSLLFGLNPVHVESVAWISERKDVLYAFFFLCSTIAYQFFLQKKDWILYGLSLTLFLCAMLSKAMAASLPLVLILVCFMENRRWNWKIMIDKIPYIIIALFLGAYAVRIQAEGSAIGGNMFPLGMRILHAGYGFTAYIIKILMPYGLSAFYPYPYPLINSGWVINTTPSIFYLTLLVAIVVFGFSFFCVVSKDEKLHIPGFGLLFYAFTIALVLQFLPVGRAIMADRYAYIPSIGLFFIIGHYSGMLYHHKVLKWLVLTTITLYAGFMFVGTMSQTRVWENDITLWDNVIRIYPQDNRIALVYANRAQCLLADDKPKEALSDLLVVVHSNSKDDHALDKIGKIYGKYLHNIDSSLYYFKLAEQANPQNFEAITDLTIAYGIKGDLHKSLEYALRGLAINKNDAHLLFNAGITYSHLGQQALGEEYFKKAFEIDPSLKPK